MTIISIVVFQGFVFLALILIMRHFMKGHVSGAVGHLQKLNDELVKQQTDLKSKIADAQREYETKMAKLQQEITQKQAQVKEEVTKTLEDSRARALAEREKIINEAVQTRDKMRQEVMAEMEDKAIQHSKSLIAQFFSGELRRLVQEALLLETLDGIREVSVDMFEITTDTAKVRVAEAMNEEDKKKIQATLREKIKKDVLIKEEIDPSLIGGIIVTFGSFVIDGSLLNRMSEAAAKLKKETARKYQGTM